MERCFRLVTSVGRRKNSEFRDKTKNIFLYFFTEPKTYNLSYSIYKNVKILYCAAVKFEFVDFIRK